MSDHVGNVRSGRQLAHVGCRGIQHDERCISLHLRHQFARDPANQRIWHRHEDEVRFGQRRLQRSNLQTLPLQSANSLRVFLTGEDLVCRISGQLLHRPMTHLATCTDNDNRMHHVTHSPPSHVQSGMYCRK